MAYKVEKDFRYNGLRCVVVFTEMGHRCGYVGVPASHPYFRVDYGSNTKDLPSPESVFDCHGGITYAGGGEYPVKSDDWFFGFDCAHAGDKSDYNQSLEYGLIDAEQLKMYNDMRMKWLGGVIRSADYVENECVGLAKQLSEYK